MLSDRGIKQAVKKGILKFDPELKEEQIQPASIDMFYEKMDSREKIPHLKRGITPYIEDVLQPGYIYDLVSTQSMYIKYDMKVRMDLRSSLRRLGAYIRVPTVMGAFGPGTIPYGFKAGLEVVNPVNISIKLHRGDKIAQLMYVFEAPSESEMKDNNIYFLKGKEEYKEFLELEHGVIVKDNETARKLAREGYFSVSTGETFKKGFLAIHAGKEAYLVRKSTEVEFGKKNSLDNVLEKVSLPYKLKPGEHIAVEAKENLDLSERIGMQFYNLPLAVTKKELFSGNFMVDGELRGIADGWVDPGYKGAFSRQPKTYYSRGVNIKEGDILGYARLIYFENGVERPYGSKGLGSHYQNADKTVLNPTDK